ncbi:hypothetical protein THF1C08_70007 [Vibrio jasicida]|uniref:Uncharacterized protein n=1 Tax=Vibrio jasicida TaxID=766224 RepID=A0AAU9QX40_9VIBR|nr:hypothetical protein THF1C08_70007 [Vibrio jasicida]CAH1602532.1 hypothetical protein THF1A12_60007 [Vibrio jasicida]
MDLVLAKVKGRSKKSIFKLLSDETLFDELVVTDDACVGYAPDHNLDEDSWFKIDNFSQQPYCLEILKTDFDSKDYDDLPKAKFKDIAQLYAVQGDNFYFQKKRLPFLLPRK